VPVSLPLIRADALLIERVLVNLIENAAKYAGPAARIGIGAHATEREVLVEVWDDGPGIPAGKEREIFEKFTRGDKESTLPGVGLGLSICRAIVAAHGGKIHCENRMEGGVVRGARFVFTLPRTEPPAPPIEEPVQALIAQ
jgi:two-component system, OmpR family, sensor histidine kinase KdpD